MNDVINDIDPDVRNAEVYRLKQEGFTVRALAQKYSLSPEWIRRVCEEEERKHRAKENNDTAGQLDTTDIYFLVVEENALGKNVLGSKASKIPLQAYHCKCQRRTQEEQPTIEYFRKLTDDEIRDAHGVGAAIEAFLSKVKQRAST